MDKYAPSLIALAGCVALVVTNSTSLQDAFSGFTNDIVFIILGTELFGIACQKSGLASMVSDFICNNIRGNNEKAVMRRIIFVLGIVAAVLSAFLNNQEVSSLAIITCISISQKEMSINVKTITLPVIYAVILGGQCTLVGAPATLVSSSMSKELVGYELSMFSLLPMGAVILTTILSNFIANTTTIIMILPIVISIVNQYGFNVEPFVIAITMAAGLSVMTPLSCGFIGMTMRLGYKFKDYIKYGAGFQLLITSLVIVMTCSMYSF